MLVGDCPDPAELTAFSVGGLPVARIEQLAAHIDACTTCQGWLANLDGQTNGMVEAIRLSRTIDSNEGCAEVSEPGPRGESATENRRLLDAEGPGTRIGPYTLTRLLGEGGFGSVFLAEQTHPVARRVALKLIKLGMDTRQVVARFEAERQALALMDHPGIARVLDAGATATGRPFFVMELVKGVPITEYCDSNRLSVRDRLKLFIQVCRAVQHAHNKGIIHRDLKPTNVLVAIQDGRPVPRIIDFGIAKAMDGRTLGDRRTMMTEHHQLIGTPQYMSPEQAEAGDLDVDTRSDIYSLGVLLYELLTGTTPFEARFLRTDGPDGIARKLRDTDAPRPSHRLTMIGADALTSAALQRRIEARKLKPAIRGDLDWITMKCLEKDRTTRYETANALAMDIERHLNDELVLAGAPSAGHRIGKFVRRHRSAVGAAATVVVALVLGLGLAIYGWMRAGADRDLARAAQAAEARARVALEQTSEARDRAEQARLRAQAQAVLTASPESAVTALDAMHLGAEAVVPLFKEHWTTAPPGSRQRIRAACALALLAAPGATPSSGLADNLVGCIIKGPASEGRLVVPALAILAAGKSDVHLRADLQQRAAAEKDVRTRARLIITLLFLGDDLPAVRILGPVTDPTPRSAFISEFAAWHGDLTLAPGLLQRLPEESRGGLCLAIGRVDSRTTTDPERQAVLNALANLYTKSPDGGVHVACEYALDQWQSPLPQIVGGDRPAPDRGWFHSPQGLTMVRIPAGLMLLGEPHEEFAQAPVLFTRPLYVSSREISLASFQAFADDTTVAAADRPSGWNGEFVRLGPSDTSAAGMTFGEALQFCNWMSRREGRHPCYTRAGTKPANWTCDYKADGYRLPTQVEWEYLARAGTTTRFACSDDPSWIEDYAALAIAAPHAGGRMPNRWGLMDTMGGVWEMSWNVQMSGHREPMIDPHSDISARGVWERGGATETAANSMRPTAGRIVAHDKREPALGFRVVCAAVPASQPPDIPPPADPAELWVRALAMRPADFQILVMASDYLARQSRFADATDMLEKAVQLRPEAQQPLYSLAVLRLEQGDADGYLKACAVLLERAEKSNDPATWERAANLRLASSLPGPDARAAISLARRAAQKSGVDATGGAASSANAGMFLLTSGLAEYRAGSYAKAAAILEKARLLQVEALPFRSEIDLSMAMALQHTGHPYDAKGAWTRETRVLDRRQPQLGNDLGPSWPDWMICGILRRESEREIFGTAATQPATLPATRPVHDGVER